MACAPSQPTGVRATSQPTVSVLVGSRRPMTLAMANITLDCDDPGAQAAFWGAALGKPVDPVEPDMAPFFACVNGKRHGGPAYLFIKVPEGKAAKNRQHIDWTADDREDEVARLIGLGATRVGDYDEWGAVWTTLRDPEGNEFCVASHH